jgi:hypothetical protein
VHSLFILIEEDDLSNSFLVNLECLIDCFGETLIMLQPTSLITAVLNLSLP